MRFKTETDSFKEFSEQTIFFTKYTNANLLSLLSTGEAIAIQNSMHLSLWPQPEARAVHVCFYPNINIIFPKLPFMFFSFCQPGLSLNRDYFDSILTIAKINGSLLLFANPCLFLFFQKLISDSPVV